MKNLIKFISTLFLLLGLFTACSNGLDKVYISVSLTEDSNRTILPEGLKKEELIYELWGNDSSTSTPKKLASWMQYTEMTSARSVEVSVDVWNFYLMAFKDNVPVLQGTLKDKQITYGVNNLSFTLGEYSGTGNIEYSYYFPLQLSGSSYIEGTLFDSKGNKYGDSKVYYPTSDKIYVNGTIYTKINFSLKDLPNGFYIAKFEIKINDGYVNTYSYNIFTTTFKVVTGLTTKGEEYLTNPNYTKTTFADLVPLAWKNNVDNTQFFWDKQPGAKKYHIYRYKTPDHANINSITDWEEIAETDADTNYYTVTNPSLFYEYYYTVKADDGKTLSKISNTIGYDKHAAPVTNLTGTTLSWYSIDGASKYTVYSYKSYTKLYEYYGAPSFNPSLFTQVAELEPTANAASETYTVTRDPDYYTYYFVTASDIGEGAENEAESDYSTYNLLVKFDAPAVSLSGTTLSWTGIDGAVSYQLYTYNSLTGSESVNEITELTKEDSLSTTTTSITLSRDPNYYYYYAVKAYDGVTYSNYSNIKMIEKFMTPTIILSGSTLSWNSVANASSYYVYEYSTTDDSGSANEFDKDLFSNYSEINGYSTTISPNSAYYNYYSVRAYDSASDSYSKYSNVIKIDKFGAPTVSFDDSTKKIIWNTVNGASKFFLYEYASSTEVEDPAALDDSLFTYFDETTDLNYSPAPYLSKYLYIRVKAYSSENSTYSDFSRTIAIPKAVLAITRSDIYLHWNSLTNASSYEVYKYTSSTEVSDTSTLSASDFTLFDSGSSTATTISLSMSEFNYFIVRAYSSSEDAYSNFSEIYALPKTESMSITLSGVGNKINWYPIAEADQYNIYCYYSTTAIEDPSTIDASDFNKIDTTTGNSYAVSTSTSYYSYYAITAENTTTSTELSLSNIIEVEKDFSPKIRVEDNYLVWDSVPGATSYTIYYYSSSTATSSASYNESSLITYSTTSSTSYSINSLSTSYAYFYVVKAYNGSKYSDYSNVIFRPKLPSAVSGTYTYSGGSATVYTNSTLSTSELKTASLSSTYKYYYTIEVEPNTKYVLQFVDSNTYSSSGLNTSYQNTYGNFDAVIYVYSPSGTSLTNSDTAFSTSFTTGSTDTVLFVCMKPYSSSSGKASFRIYKE